MDTLPPCFDYRPGWVVEPERMFGQLREAIAWEQNEISIAGRRRSLPRLTCWMGEAPYVYSGIRNEPLPMPAELQTVRRRLEAESQAGYNSCLANLYRDGRDSIGYHSDDEAELGLRPVIASISLGGRRRFLVKRVSDGRRWTLELGAGDLLIMRDESQADYRHAVPKTTRTVAPRINLTFRWFG